MTHAETSGADSSAPEPTPGLPPSKPLEAVTAIIAIAMSTSMVLFSRAIHVNRETGGIDPRWWPTMLGAISLGLAVLLLVVALTRPMLRDDVEPTSRSGRINALITVVVAIGYAFAWPAVGFIPATLALLVILTAVYGARNWKVLVFFPVGLTAFLYILFATLLRVPL